MNSSYIKLALMKYWRFDRQMISVDEISYGNYIADIIVLRKDGLVHEIEVKCSKSDLCTLELKKQKHLDMTKKFYPHYFSFAVPTELVEDAKKIIEQLNPRYGLIEIKKDVYEPIFILKSALQLHNHCEQNFRWREKVMYRLNSSLIGLMQILYQNHE